MPAAVAVSNRWLMSMVSIRQPYLPWLDGLLGSTFNWGILMAEDKYNGEKVLGIAASVLAGITSKTGLILAEEVPQLVEQLDAPRDQSEFRLRIEAEEDPSFKQLIPYVVFLRGGRGIEEIFRYTRSKGQGESRLLNNHSVGIGGHINLSDVRDGLRSAYRVGFERELAEELFVPGGYEDHELIGFIHDPSNPVGQVHLGVVHVIKTPKEIEVKDDSMANPQWLPLRRTLSELEAYENWSRIVIEHLVSL